MAAPISYVEGQHNQIAAIVDHVTFKKTLPESFWQWFLEMGLWHLRELKLDTWQDVKSVLLPVTDRKTVILPPDYVSWCKIGTIAGQYIITLGVNNKLNTLDRTVDSNFINGLMSQNLPNGLDFGAYGGYYFFNYNGASVPAYGSGFITKGSFKISQIGSTKEILLDYDYCHDTVLVEYISDGFCPCGETIVDPYFADYVKKGMEFTWEEEKEPNRTEASIFRRGSDFAAAERKVRARKNDLDPQTLINISRANTRFTPKI